MVEGTSNRVEKSAAASYFGGLAIVSLGMQVLTGILLAFSYQPTTDHAYASTYYISNVMAYGWLVRTIHAWGGILAAGFVVAHALAVFVTASYKRPHRARANANWILGLFAGIVIAAMGFTGRLLPWDQLAYWSTDAGLSLLEKVPVLGGLIEAALTTPEGTAGTLLTRFFAAHVILLPAGLLTMIVAHVWIARDRFLTQECKSPAGETETDGAEVPQIGAPYSVRLASAATTIVLLLSVYTVLAILAPATLEVRADPSGSATTFRPSWQLLPLYFLDRFLPVSLVAAVALALVAGLAALPYLDRGPSRRSSDRVLVLGLGFALAGSLLALGILGAAS